MLGAKMTTPEKSLDEMYDSIGGGELGGATLACWRVDT
jgi:hypothetical protein